MPSCFNQMLMFPTGSGHERPQVRVLREDVLQRGPHGLPQEEDAHALGRAPLRLVSVCRDHIVFIGTLY